MSIAYTAKMPETESCFESEAVGVMRDLRGAFLSVMQGLKTPIHRATELERALGIRTTLAWQVFRVATAENPLEAGSHVPGSAAVRQMTTAARDAGVDEQVLQEVEVAMQAFEQLVQRHAGDRGMFTSMIGSLAGEASDQSSSSARRQAFRANSQLWGVQVKAQLWSMLWHPGKGPLYIHNASIRGLRDVRWLRRGPRFAVSTRRAKDEGGTIREPVALDGGENDTFSGPTLLTEYCSKPCAKLINRVDEDGFVRSYLAEAPLGKAGSQTLFLADVVRDYNLERDKESGYLTSAVTVTKPSEVLVIDSLVHRAALQEARPSVSVQGSLQRLGTTDHHFFLPEDTLPVGTEVQSLGSGRAALATSHIPRYGAMVDSVCQQIGWTLDDFDVYRCVIEYPILGSLVKVSFPISDLAE